MSRRDLRVCPVHRDKPWPERRPKRCCSGGERQGHPSPRDHHPGTRAQNPLAQAAQAPSRSGRLFHGSAGDVHDLIGKAGDEQAHLIAGEGIDGQRHRLWLLALPMRLCPVGRGMSHVAPLVRATMANARASTSFSSPMWPSALLRSRSWARTSGHLQPRFWMWYMGS